LLYCLTLKILKKYLTEANITKFLFRHNQEATCL